MRGTCASGMCHLGIAEGTELPGTHCEAGKDELTVIRKEVDEWYGNRV